MALFFELLNNRVACALISDRTGEILGAWGGQERIRAGQVYVAPRGSNRFLPGVDAESTFIENVSRSDLPKLGEICRRFLVGLDRQQMEEVFYRSGVEPEMELPSKLTCYMGRARPCFKRLKSVALPIS